MYLNLKTWDYENSSSARVARGASAQTFECVSKIELVLRARPILGARHVLRNFLTVRALTRYFVVIPSLKT